MSMTEKNDLNKRVWTESFLDIFGGSGVVERFRLLVLGLCESGFVESSSRSISPLSRVVDLVLDDVLVVRLYLVELNNDHVICYRVSLVDNLDHDDTDTIFELGLNTIWEDIRRVWRHRFL